MAAHEPVPKPISNDVIAPKVGAFRLTLGDSIHVIALLLGIYFVMVVPPLWLKVALLICVVAGVFWFAKRSYWTQGWSAWRQGIASFAVVILLLGVGIPQFISQWQVEHPKAAPTGVLQPPAVVDTNPVTSTPQGNVQRSPPGYKSRVSEQQYKITAVGN